MCSMDHLRFSKLHANGNDFVFLNGINQHVSLSAEEIRGLADRRKGIGFDQLVVVRAARPGDGHFALELYNVDGRECGQCGNACLCFPLFAAAERLSTADPLRLRVGGRWVQTRTLRSGDLNSEIAQLDFGPPDLAPASLPFVTQEEGPHHTLLIGQEPGCELTFTAVSMGNPHVVMVVDSVDDAPVEDVGKAMQHHPQLPDGTNVGFMQIMDRSQFALRVYERGAGETPACGSGAAAAMVTGSLRGQLERECEVRMPGGSLRVHWEGEGSSLRIEAPTTRVFEGVIRG